MRDLATIRSGSVLVLLASIAMVGCQPAETGKMEGTAIDTAAVMSSLDSLRQAFVEAYNAADTAAIAAMFTEDAVVLPSGAPPVRGRDSIAASFAREWARGAQMDELTALETTLINSDWVMEYGDVQITVTPQDADQGRTMDGSYLVVLHRTADGWKLVRDAASMDSTPSGAPGR